MSGNQLKEKNNSFKNYKNKVRIIFMGTPEFAIPSLKALKNNYYVAGVVTAPDKQSGRGLKIKQSPVKKFSIENSLPVIQPEKLKDKEFINQLKKLEPDLFIVVGFRKLPDEVWKIPPLGTINLHASLLPQYRGAAPINWVLINGEETTGVTTFFIDDKIDTGKIIYRESVKISPKENAGTLHDKLMIAGSGLVVKTVSNVIKGTHPKTDQELLAFADNELKKAPKIKRENCNISWNLSSMEIYNFIRGLSPYPGAWSIMSDNTGRKDILKIFESEVLNEKHNHKPGDVLTDNKSFIKVATKEGFVNLLSLQLPGKKQQDIEPFLRGFNAEGIRFEF